MCVAQSVSPRLAYDLLAVPDELIDVGFTKKFRVLFRAEVESAAQHGTLDERLHNFLSDVFMLWTVDTQDHHHRTITPPQLQHHQFQTI